MLPYRARSDGPLRCAYIAYIPDPATGVRLDHYALAYFLLRVLRRFYCCGRRIGVLVRSVSAGRLGSAWWTRC